MWDPPRVQRISEKIFKNSGKHNPRQKGTIKIRKGTGKCPKREGIITIQIPHVSPIGTVNQYLRINNIGFLTQGFDNRLKIFSLILWTLGGSHIWAMSWSQIEGQCIQDGKEQCELCAIQITVIVTCFNDKITLSLFI